MNHNHNGAQPEAYSNVEPYYSEFNRMLRIPSSPPSTKEKMKWAESHLESLTLAKGRDSSPHIPIPRHPPATLHAQDDIKMQLDREILHGEYVNPNLSVPTAVGNGWGSREGQQTSGMEIDSMDVDVVDGGDSFGRKRKADGEVDEAPPCKRK
ncbi:hypothetical protein E1B28_006558 [Marasmius oreades]|uniref:Uncharacterized protein n=1 Tax=Marasmius oreades TaxID=181124 RepID=A0A9P7UW78_9AGAR|nr:uncharacterized protein E1B28_006558 [Marasmius oreades]KAG7095866.1 hypothetical protein E1B28_006558 [Marasmius oreades]